MRDDSAHAYFSAVRLTYFKVAFVTVHEKSWIFPFPVQLVVCTRLSQSVTASQKHFKKFLVGEKRYYCSEKRRFSFDMLRIMG